MKDKLPSMFEDVRRMFVSYLEERGHRKTPERFTILREIYSFNGHFDIETLYTQMKSSRYRVSRATLYNTIELLLDSGLVAKHQFGKNCAQFEKSFNFGQHDHVICLNSNKVFEFCDPRIQAIKESLEKMMGIRITHHSLTFYALCNDEETNENET